MIGLRWPPRQSIPLSSYPRHYIFIGIRVLHSSERLGSFVPTRPYYQLRRNLYRGSPGVGLFGRISSSQKLVSKDFRSLLRMNSSKGSCFSDEIDE
jgi:hypothetical protein